MEQFHISEVLWVCETLTSKSLDNTTITASVSRDGILGVWAYNHNKSGVQLYNFVSESSVYIPLMFFTQVVFCEGSVLLLVRNHELYEARTSNVLSAPTMDTFTTIQGPKVCWASDTSLTEATHKLYFSDLANSLYEYNIDTHKFTQFCKGLDAYFNAQMTGIALKGVQAIVRDFNSLLHVVYDETTEEPLFKIDEFAGCLIIPSQSTPDDLRTGLVVSNRHTYLNGKTIETPVELQCYFSIVRLYRDLFILFDFDMHKWVIRRISVP